MKTEYKEIQNIIDGYTIDEAVENLIKLKYELISAGVDMKTVRLNVETDCEMYATQDYAKVELSFKRKEI